MPVLTQEIAELDNLGAKVPAGTHTFVDLTGLISLPRKRMEVLQRRGVDDACVRQVATQPQPFRLVSLGFEDTFAAYEAKLTALQSLIGKAYGVKLTKNGEDFGTFDVIDVEKATDPEGVVYRTAGSPKSSGVRMVCGWTLIARTP